MIGGKCIDGRRPLGGLRVSDKQRRELRVCVSVTSTCESRLQILGLSSFLSPHTHRCLFHPFLHLHRKPDLHMVSEVAHMTHIHTHICTHICTRICTHSIFKQFATAAQNVTGKKNTFKAQICGFVLHLFKNIYQYLNDRIVRVIIGLIYI